MQIDTQKDRSKEKDGHIDGKIDEYLNQDYQEAQKWTNYVGSEHKYIRWFALFGRSVIKFRGPSYQSIKADVSKSNYKTI